MKLRIKGNSIRLRLMQSEVADFQATGKVVEAVDFGAQQLVYRLQETKDSEISVIFENNIMTIFLPKKVSHQWANSNQVSIAENVELSENKILKILVEKDFKCLTDRPEEDESDAYPHPKEGTIFC